MSKISTSINIIDHIKTSEEDLSIITLAAQKDAEAKLRYVLGDTFQISDYDLSFELICKTTIIKKK